MNFRKNNSAFRTIPVEQPQQPENPEFPVFGEILHRMDPAVNIPLKHAVTAFILVFALGFSLAMTFQWLFWIWPTVTVGVVAAIVVWLYEMWRWSVMRERISKIDANKNGVPDVLEKGYKNVVITVKDKRGSLDQARTTIDERHYPDILIMARSFNATRKAPQQAMEKNHSISRPMWDKIIQEVFLKLDVIEKESDAPNSTWIRKDDQRSREVLENLAYGHYEVLNKLWEGD